MQQDSDGSNMRPAPGAMSRAETKVRALLEDQVQVDALIRSLRIYVYRFNLASGVQVNNVADEVLSDVVVQALRAVDRFDPDRSVMPWLLGIGVNVIKRRKERAARLANEQPIDEGSAVDEWLFDHVAQLRQEDFTRAADDDDAVERLLAPLEEDDREVVRLAILHRMNGVEVARVLGIRPGTARQRLHRALGRLRTIWAELNDKGYEE